MAFVTEYQSDGARLVLSGHVTIADAAPLHAALLELTGTAGSISVDDSRVIGFDTSLLQLLIAFARARRAGRGVFSLDAGPVTHRLEQLGLGREVAACRLDISRV